MAPRQWKFESECSDRLYTTLLLLYPAGFRLRFGPEMTQLFRDQRRREMTGAGAGRSLVAWLNVLHDLACSIPREWQRALTAMLSMVRSEGQVDFPGLADAFMISVVVGTNLLVWGWTGAVIALDLEAPVNSGFWTTGAMVVTAIVAFALAVLVGILSASVVARSGRTERTGIRG